VRSVSRRNGSIEAYRPLLGNDRKQSLRQRPVNSNRNGAFCAVRADGYVCNNKYSNKGSVFSLRSVSSYKQDN
jgi:hypothetical protein